MIIKNNIGSSSFIDVGETHLIMASGPMSISSDRKGGNFINGPLSISSPPTSVRIGGVYKFNPMTMLGLPSTLVTPIPTFSIEPPVKEIAGLASLTSMVLSTVG